MISFVTVTGGNEVINVLAIEEMYDTGGIHGLPIGCIFPLN